MQRKEKEELKKDETQKKKRKMTGEENIIPQDTQNSIDLSKTNVSETAKSNSVEIPKKFVDELDILREEFNTNEVVETLKCLNFKDTVIKSFEENEITYLNVKDLSSNDDFYKSLEIKAKGTISSLKTFFSLFRQKWQEK